MPHLIVYSRGGEDVFEEDAISVDPNGASATFQFPSGLDPDIYGLSVANVDSSYQYEYNTFNFLSIAGTQSFSSPVGVAAVYTSTTYTDYQGYDIDGDCEGYSYYNTWTTDSHYPIVTQYGSGTVTVGAASIPVGSNPTAIAVYGSGTSYDSWDDTRCNGGSSYSTFPSSAIVANSGSGTVSILDLNANSVVSTISTGTNPVAIVLSPDQAYAYVANYGSNTVSKIDLNSNSLVGTLSVSAPTSLGFHSDGTLWIGSGGSIVRADAGSMTALGSTGTGGYTVLGLSQATMNNNLVALVSDAGGNLFEHEVDSSALANSQSYSPYRAAAVSTLGTYSIGGSNVRAYSSTLAGSPNPLQLASGALADTQSGGWLAVVPTTVGFVVTDTADHADLFAGTTPGPVTSISVDSMDHVAYIAVPDSNELLSVPLPDR